MKKIIKTVSLLALLTLPQIISADKPSWAQNGKPNWVGKEDKKYQKQEWKEQKDREKRQWKEEKIKNKKYGSKKRDWEDRKEKEYNRNDRYQKNRPINDQIDKAQEKVNKVQSAVETIINTVK